MIQNTKSEIEQIPGVKVVELKKFKDQRGSLFEMYRKSWDSGIDPIQWNIVHSVASTIRAFHVHIIHFDYLVCVQGQFYIAVKDLRKHSPTYLQNRIILVDANSPSALVIPPGVGHGFEFHNDTITCYGIDTYWEDDPELDCRFDETDLGIDWSFSNPLLSERDDKSKSFNELIQNMEIHQDKFSSDIKKWLSNT